MTDAIWPRNIDADGVHEQEVLGVLLQAHLVDHPGGHGEGGDAGSTDHGVDLLPCRNRLRNLAKSTPPTVSKTKATRPRPMISRVSTVRKASACMLEGHGDAQEQGDQVGQHLLGRLGQAVQHAALADQVAEHQEADRATTLRGDTMPGDDGDDDGEQDAWWSWRRAWAHTPCGCSRSFLVVISRMTGGWTMGTRAM